MRRSICALALPLALTAACSPVAREYGPGTGGSSSSATGSSSGTGGTGGGTTANCVNSGTSFDILTPNDFGAGAQVDDHIFLVPDPGQGKPLVHVVVGDRSSGRLFVRSIVDEPNKLGNVATYGAVGGPGFRAAGGWVDGGAKLYVAGSQGDMGIGQVVFPVDPHQGVLQAAGFNGGPTPLDCLPPNYVNRLEVVQNGGDMRYVVTCNLPNNVSSLWVGSYSAGPVPVIPMGDPNDVMMRPQLYSWLNGVHFIGFGQDFGASVFLSGTDAELSPTAAPFTLEPNQFSIFMGFTPLPTNDGIVLFAASVDPNLTGGSIWGGPVHTGDYMKLQSAPQAFLKQYFSFATISAAAGFTNPTFDANHIVTAGASFTKDAVYFDLLERDGAPLVIEQQVYTPTGASILAAAAAPRGLTSVIAWVEQDGSSPPNYTVRGQEVVCTGG